MSLISDLISNSASVSDLESFIASNYPSIYDFFVWSPDEDLNAQRTELGLFLHRYRQVIVSLPVANNTNLSFLALLLDASERLGSISAFTYLYTFLKQHHYNIGSRLEAASCYMIDAKKAEVLLERYARIYELLQNSYENEEDNADKVITTLINYYSRMVIDFGEFNVGIAENLRANIRVSAAADEYSFLHFPVIVSILAVDLLDNEWAYAEIHRLLDIFLRRGKTKGKELTGYLIESGTDYSIAVKKVRRSFNEIRQLSVANYVKNGNKGIFTSLNRGIAILNSEIQMHGYLHSYGKMHYAKLLAAFEFLPKAMFSKKVNIIDWGCGQAMASMCFLEYCESNSIELDLEKVTLIEPSDMALKRGALLVETFRPGANIVTINKNLDDVTNKDFEMKTGVNLHFFSNILDINAVSLTKLITLIKTNFAGKNHFVVVSPYVDDTRKSKLHSFVQQFRTMHNFQAWCNIAEKSGQWENDWTRLCHVFSVDLNFKD